MKRENCSIISIYFSQLRIFEQFNETLLDQKLTQNIVFKYPNETFENYLNITFKHLFEYIFKHLNTYLNI